MNVTASPVEEAHDRSKAPECDGLECYADYQAKSKRRSLTVDYEMLIVTCTCDVLYTDLAESTPLNILVRY
jgi:hypothetical protein